MDLFKLITARYFLFVYAGISLFILSPLFIVVLAKGLAVLSGCPSTGEFSNAVCTNGDILYAFMQADWLLVITMPIGFFLLGVAIGLHILLFLLMKKRAAVALFIMDRVRRKFTK